MASPFPGMDPYLEQPDMWPSAHLHLIHYIAEDLQPQLLPRYVASVEERVYLEPAEKERTPDMRVTAREEPAWSPWARGGGVAVAEPEVEVGLPEPEWVTAEPDLEVAEAYLEIIDRAGHEVVTVIEVLSPSN